jgi:hypothetical protein
MFIGKIMNRAQGLFQEKTPSRVGTPLIFLYLGGGGGGGHKTYFFSGGCCQISI